VGLGEIAGDAERVHTTVSPSRRHGTLPVGENARNFCQLEPASKGTRRSAKGMPRAFMSTHGRNDHDE